MKINFHYPERGAWYSPEQKTAYIWGGNENMDLCQAIIHETLHYVLDVMFGKEVTHQFDDVAKKVLEWDETTFYLLY